MAFRECAQRFRALVRRHPLPTPDEARWEMRAIAALAIVHYRECALRGVHGFNPDIVQIEFKHSPWEDEDRILRNSAGRPRILDIENDLRQHFPDRIPVQPGVPAYSHYCVSPGVPLATTSGHSYLYGDGIVTVVEYPLERWRQRAEEYAIAMDCLAELAGENEPKPKRPLDECLRELDAAITQYLDDHEGASGRWPDAIGVWAGCPVHDAVVAVETALGTGKLPDPALLHWKTLLRHCRDSTHWPQGWPPDELWASAKKLRAWASEQLDGIRGEQSGNVPIWSVALKMQEIAGVFGCEAKKRTVQPLLEAVGSDLKELPRRKYQVRLDRMDPAYRPAFEKKSGRG